MFHDLEFIKTMLNGLRSRIEKVEDWAVSENQVTQAVADYFVENPIIESDPTVSAWAKEPTKPTYTAAEIGAQPDMYVNYFDGLLNDLAVKTVVYVAATGATSPIPSDRYPVLFMRSGINMGQASIVAYDAAGKTWTGSVNFAQGTIYLVERTLTASDIGAIPVPTTAAVGQTIVVKTVDADGKPTEWGAVDMASGEDDVPVYLGTIPVSQDTVSYLVAPVKDYKKVVIVKERASQNNNLNSYLYARLYQPETKKNFILAASNKTGYSFFVCKLECVSNDFVEGEMFYSNNATLTPAVSGMIPHSSVFSNSMINQNMPIDIDSYYYEFDVANASLTFDGNETVHVWGWKR